MNLHRSALISLDRLPTAAAALLCAALFAGGFANHALGATLEPAGSYALDDVHGRIDHLAYDAAGHRLFVAALGNDTVEVLDAENGKRLYTISGEKEPQGVRYLPGANVLVVAAGEGGSVDFFNGKTLAPFKRQSGYDDADNVRFDVETRQAIVGWGAGALTWFTSDGGKIASVSLPAHPESFQISPSRKRVYVNVPNASKVCVIDKSAHKLVASWPVHNASANYPMCLDEDEGIVFIGCRHPAEIIAFDASSGNELGRVAGSGDADDLFYDKDTKCIFESCGEGFIDVFRNEGKGRLTRIDHVATAPGARTSLFVPELKTLFLAVPLRRKQPCEIRAYRVK